MIVVGVVWVLVVAALMVATAGGWHVEKSWSLPDRERAVVLGFGALGMRDSVHGSISFSASVTVSSDASSQVGEEPLAALVAQLAELGEPKRVFCWWFRRGHTVPFVETYDAPLWVLAVPGAVVGCLGWRAARRCPRDRCGACNYDTHGLTSAVCPECGSTLAR